MDVVAVVCFVSVVFAFRVDVDFAFYETDEALDDKIIDRCANS